MSMSLAFRRQGWIAGRTNPAFRQVVVVAQPTTVHIFAGSNPDPVEVDADACRRNRPMLGVGSPLRVWGTPSGNRRSAEPSAHPRVCGEGRGARLHIVAPDVIGDQAASLALLAQHRGIVREIIAAGHDVLVPVQRGAMTPYQAWRARHAAGYWSRAYADAMNHARSLEPGRGALFGRGSSTWTVRQEGWFQARLAEIIAAQRQDIVPVLARLDRLTAIVEREARALGINEPWRADSHALDAARQLREDLGP